MGKAKYFFIAFLISLPFWWGVNVGEEIGRDGFVELMNLEVQILGLEDTHFVNSKE